LQRTSQSRGTQKLGPASLARRGLSPHRPEIPQAAPLRAQDWTIVPTRCGCWAASPPNSCVTLSIYHFRGPSKHFCSEKRATARGSAKGKGTTWLKTRELNMCVHKGAGEDWRAAKQEGMPLERSTIGRACPTSCLSQPHAGINVRKVHGMRVLGHLINKLTRTNLIELRHLQRNDGESVDQLPRPGFLHSDWRLDSILQEGCIFGGTTLSIFQIRRCITGNHCWRLPFYNSNILRKFIVSNAHRTTSLFIRLSELHTPEEKRLT
jgi:hypothetical protein